MEKAKILIVEDEAIIAMEVESQLQGLGYEVTSIVDTGVKAIKKAEEDKPDIILMDIRIKGEMDGIGAAEVIRNRFGIPVISSTAYLDEERIERAKITMPFGYVLKPIQERDLKVTIEMALYVSKVDAERRKADQKLNEQLDFLDSIVEQSGFAMWISDSKGIMIKSNKKLRETLNLTNEQLIGKYNIFSDKNLSKDQLKAVAEVYEQKMTQKLELYWEGAKVNNVEFEDPIDTWVEVYLFPIIDNFGNLKNVVCQWIDISCLKQTANELSTRENKYHALFENSPYGVFLVDNNAKYIEVNDAACEMTGYSKEELLCLSIPEISSPDEEIQKQDIKPFLDIKNTGKGEGIIHLVHKDGSLFKAKLKGVKIDSNTVVDICEKLKE